MRLLKGERALPVHLLVGVLVHRRAVGEPPRVVDAGARPPGIAPPAPAIASSSVSVAPHIAKTNPPRSTNCRMFSATAFLSDGMFPKPSRRAAAEFFCTRSTNHGASR